MCLGDAVADDPVLEAIDNLLGVLGTICEQKTKITRRAALIRKRRERGIALYAEGMSMDRIGSLFGVTRQRIADFVREESVEPR
jgi:hypothetical protein